jgi:hypothetical protein
VVEYLAYRGRRLALAVVLAAAGTNLGGIDGRTAEEQLGRASGTRVREGDLAWVDDAPDEDGPFGAFALRRVVFAAAPATQSRCVRDVYTAVLRVLPNGVVAAVYGLRNLTRSPAADEGDLVRGPAGAVAFAVRVGGVPVGVGLLRFPDERPEAERESGTFARLRAALRDWVRDGRPEGIVLWRMLFAVPAAGRIDFSFAGRELAVRAGGNLLASLDTERGRMTCPGGACTLETRERGLLPLGPWAADVLRSAGGLGPSFVARLEDLVLVLRDRWSSLVATVAGGRPANEAAAELAGATEPAREAGPEPEREELEPPPWPPPPLALLVEPPLPGEGEWRAFEETLVRSGARGPALLATFLRPDPSRRERSQVLVTIWDPAVVDLGFAPGTLDPPAADGTIPQGRVPRDAALLGRLLAAVSGGFQAVNGQFGQIVDRRVFVPVQPWAATMVRFDDGAIGFGTWPPGLSDLPPGVASVRQNLSALLEDGAFNPYGRKAWGGLAPLVPTDGRDEDLVATVRSAICATSDGLVAYLWGSFLTVRSLGAAAQQARCTYAVALDINPENAIVELYRVGPAEELAVLPPTGAGEATGDLDPTGLRYRAHLLLPEMADDPGRFVERSERDLLYLTLREQPLPETAPPEPDAWTDGEGERPVFAGERFALRRLFPDVAPVPPTTWWPAQRDTLPREYIRRIERLWELKGGGASRGSGEEAGSDR